MAAGATFAMLSNSAEIGFIISNIQTQALQKQVDVKFTSANHVIAAINKAFSDAVVQTQYQDYFDIRSKLIKKVTSFFTKCHLAKLDIEFLKRHHKDSSRKQRELKERSLQLNHLLDSSRKDLLIYRFKDHEVDPIRLVMVLDKYLLHTAELMDEEALTADQLEVRSRSFFEIVLPNKLQHIVKLKQQIPPDFGKHIQTDFAWLFLEQEMGFRRYQALSKSAFEVMKEIVETFNAAIKDLEDAKEYCNDVKLEKINRRIAENILMQPSLRIPPRAPCIQTLISSSVIELSCIETFTFKGRVITGETLHKLLTSSWNEILSPIPPDSPRNNTLKRTLPSAELDEEDEGVVTQLKRMREEQEGIRTKEQARAGLRLLSEAVDRINLKAAKALENLKKNCVLVSLDNPAKLNAGNVVEKVKPIVVLDNSNCYKSLMEALKNTDNHLLNEWHARYSLVDRKNTLNNLDARKANPYITLFSKCMGAGTSSRRKPLLTFIKSLAVDVGFSPEWGYVSGRGLSFKIYKPIFDEPWMKEIYSSKEKLPGIINLLLKAGENPSKILSMRL
ncbi:MAG: hypothetical protein WC222_04730 [Parachlamydiales bacterium]|jgi:hypothetical protein